MSNHITSMTAAQLSDRARKMAAESADLSKLAAQMARHEKTYGCTLFLSQMAPEPEYLGQAGPEIVLGRASTSIVRKLSEHEAPQSQTDTQHLAQAAANVGKQFRKTAEEIGKALGQASYELANKRADDAPEPAPEAPATPETPPADVPAPEARLPASKADPSKQKPQPTERHWGALSLSERRLVQHIEKLPAKFSPQEDLKIVELLTGGLKLPFVAATMELPQQDILARWKSFLTEDVLGANGQPSIDGQKQLLNALRYLKEQAA